MQYADVMMAQTFPAPTRCVTVMDEHSSKRCHSGRRGNLAFTTPLHAPSCKASTEALQLPLKQFSALNKLVFAANVTTISSCWLSPIDLSKAIVNVPASTSL
jgi:hypothetical protein